MSEKNKKIAVFGSGLTAYAVVAALSKLGYECTIYDTQQSFKPSPSLVLNDVCETLLKEIFTDVDFSQVGQRLTHRSVKWEPETKPEQVYQPAFSTTSDALIRAIQNSPTLQNTTIIDSQQIDQFDR